MKNRILPLLAVIMLGAYAATAQLVTINSPVKNETQPVELQAAQRNLMNRIVLPKVRRNLASTCEESFEPAAVIIGSFSRPQAEQSLIFYQFCQTGNGYGFVGLVLIENNKVVGNYTAEAGWSIGAKQLPDINQNGLDEFALHYSGGIHQGAGGVGVDIMEFGPKGITAIGWFQAESFDEESDTISYKVSVKPGKIPAYFREKYVSSSDGKWRKVGRQAPLKLTKATSKFVAVK